MLISIETLITCDFPGGGPDPISASLDPHKTATIHMSLNDGHVGPFMSHSGNQLEPIKILTNQKSMIFCSVTLTLETDFRS